MNSMFADVMIGAVAFAATNIDDILLLALFFSQTSLTFRGVHIVMGQCLGFSALVVISLLGYLGGHSFPRAWIGLLGVVPILLAIRLWRCRGDHSQETDKSPANSLVAVAAVTFANGADNIGVYTPLFASSDPQRLTLVLVTFYVLLAVWCFVGAWVGRHPRVAPILTRYGDFIVPLAFLGLGICIVVESGSLRLLGF